MKHDLPPHLSKTPASPIKYERPKEMNNKFIKSTVIAILSAATPGIVLADQVQDEINKQISNIISNAINARLASTLTPETKPLDTGAYGSLSHLRFSASGSRSESDFGIAGIDYGINKDVIAGVALSYADFRGGHGTGVTPYIAYMLNNVWYLKGTINYSHSSASGAGNSDAWGYGVSINAVKKIDNWRLSAGLGVGGSSSDNSNDTTNYAAEGQAVYDFGNKWFAVAGLNINATDRQNSYSTTGSVGIERLITKDAALSFKYSTLIDDNFAGPGVDVDIFTLGVRARF